MSLLTKRNVVLCKQESTYNTDPTPTAANDAMLVENLTHGPANQKMYDQAAAGKPTFGKRKQLYGGKLWTVSFDVLIKGSGTAGTAPEYGAALQACGLDETIVASTSVTYAPVSSSIASVTFYIYEDGKLYKITGCRGTINLSLNAGDPGRISMSFTGHFAGDSDTALVTPTLDTTEAPIIVNAGFSIDSYSAVIAALTLDYGVQIATPMSVNESDGYGEILITDRDVTGTINPQDVLIATKDFMAAWEAGTEMAMTTGVIGSTAGNQFQLSGSKSYIRDMSLGDSDGLRILDLTLGYLETSGDDSVSLAFT